MGLYVAKATQPRIDLPEVGMRIVALHHGSGQWYYGPLEVLEVDPLTRRVEVQPEYWRNQGRTMVFTPSDVAPHPLQWNRLEDITEPERDYVEQRKRT